MRHDDRQLAPQHATFLRESFHLAPSEAAAPGLRGTYALLRRTAGRFGLVAVAADGTVWYKSAVRDEAPRCQAALSALGFVYSEQNLLAALYAHLPFESHPTHPAEHRPAPSARPLATVHPIRGPKAPARRPAGGRVA